MACYLGPTGVYMVATFCSSDFERHQASISFPKNKRGHFGVLMLHEQYKNHIERMKHNKKHSDWDLKRAIWFVPTRVAAALSAI